jgi:2-oxo-3-hexenedioate decarboxylase
VTDARSLAARLLEARRLRTPIPKLSDGDPDLDLETGYAVQRLLREQHGRAVGWKLAMTSRAKQREAHIESPVRGFLAAEHVLEAGELLVTSELINPRCEPEIVVMVGRDLGAADTSMADVMAAISGVAAGIEVVDSRFIDSRFTIADLVADNASACRYIAGKPVPLDGMDLGLVGVVLTVNGEAIDTAAGVAALGNPAAAVAWLARSLAASGELLRKGDVVLTGGLTASVPVSPGDVVVATVDRVGSVELRCR